MAPSADALRGGRKRKKERGRGRELRADEERGILASSLTYDETHCDIIRKTYLVADADKLATTCYGQHLQGEGTTEAEASAASGKPEGYLLVGRRVLLREEREKRMSNSKRKNWLMNEVSKG